jgi:hypothetical protein
MFRNQPPVAALSAGGYMHQREGSVGSPEHSYFHNRQQQQLQGRSSMPAEYPPDSVEDDLRSVSSAGGYHHTSPYPARQQHYYSQPQAAHQQQLVPVTVVSELPSTVELSTVAQQLAFARGLDKIPSPPQFCREAFLLLHRGTYLIKYGRTGNPHERFLALRFVRDDRTKRMYPYLVWAVHQEAVSFKERIPLVHLVSASAGVAGCAGFRRYMVDQTSITGPFVNGKRSVLPCTYAFSWTFQSASQSRVVECLALDPETFQCWVLVGQYLASLNSGAELVEEAETLAPDTPRSTSASVATADR